MLKVTSALIFSLLLVACTHGAPCQNGVIQNCNSCTPTDLTVCNRCQSGYKLTNAGTPTAKCVMCADYTGKVSDVATSDKQPATNEVCDVTCDLTLGVKICKAANEPLVCLDNYNLSGGNCVACHRSCAACTAPGASACTSCIANYFLEGGSCKPCQAGQFAAHKNTASSCKSCDATCGECAGAADRCVTCKDGLVIGSHRKCMVPQVAILTQNSLTFLQILSTFAVVGISVFFSL